MSDAATSAPADLGLKRDQLVVGDPAPWFVQRSSSSAEFHFDTASGRYLVLGFFLTASDETGRQALGLLDTHRKLFDDERFSFFGVSVDPEDEKRLQPSLPGVRFLWDFDRRVSRLYGALRQVDGKGMVAARRHWLVLDPAMQVIGAFPITPGNAELAAFLDGLPPPGEIGGREIHAPVLVAPKVFEPEFCRMLIGLYEAEGGQELGFMTEEKGLSVNRHDPLHKRRRDLLIQDEQVREAAKARIARRVMPLIARAYQFKVTRIERYLIACYAPTRQAISARTATTPPGARRIAASRCQSI